MVKSLEGTQPSVLVWNRDTSTGPVSVFSGGPAALIIFTHPPPAPHIGQGFEEPRTVAEDISGSMATKILPRPHPYAQECLHVYCTLVRTVVRH